MIDENLPHQTRGKGQEVCAIVNRHPIYAYQAQVNLVHECGGLQCVTQLLATQLPSCQPPEFVVHEGNKTFQCFGVSLTPINE